MSEEQNGNGVTETPASGEGQNSVAYETYERTLTQAKQSKAKQRDLEQELNALRAEKEAESKSRLEEQSKYKELYEASESAVKATRAEMEALKLAQDVARKKEALSAHIGAVHKPEFLQFLNLDSVDLENPDSIVEEANRFKAEYPMVLRAATGSLQNTAAPGTPAETKPKTISDMTDDELARYMAQASMVNS